ncbi:Cytochrome c1 heme lyase [Rhizina undulata]
MSTAQPGGNPPDTPSNTPSNASSDVPTQPTCPVGHNARSSWLSSQKISASCDSLTMDQSLPTNHPPLPFNHPKLDTRREISTIPRATSEGSNSEHDPKVYGGAAEKGKPLGNWIYPSEEMFFNAMKRKEWDPKAEDMRNIVPIHNAVNERAWKEIKEWEAGRGSEKCGGPKLVSFSGDSQKLTPKARLMVLFGYQPPFDRHDWVVDRCGKKIEYVIDFYSGRRDPQRAEAVSFYLDVRPKLSPEGVWMRLQRWAGSWF